MSDFSFENLVKADRRFTLAVLGIDPGVNGGATLLSRDGRIIRTVGFNPTWPLPVFNRLLRDLMAALIDLNVPVQWAAFNSVALEKVGQIRGDGAQGAFTFGRVDGLIRGTVLSEDLRINEVLPMAWQSRLQCLSGGNKNVTEAKAAELWPDVKWTHNTADSALIAEWLRRRNHGHEE